MLESFFTLFLIVLLALLFDFTNGWNDAVNAIGTVISTRVLSPRNAVIWAAILNIIGAFFSTAVAKTIGKGIVDPASVNHGVIISALAGATIWNTAMTLIGMPVSASHALIGGVIGAAVAYKGVNILNIHGLITIFESLILSPIFGFIFGFVLMIALYNIFKNSMPSAINKNFKRFQLISASFMAFSHGSNDAQKTMGIITLALVNAGYLNTVEVPLWVMLLCAVTMGFGTAIGGWKVIKTVGFRILKLQPIHGFAAETSASAIILIASHFGLPVSTTHVILTSIMGVGATRRLSAVRWGIAGKIIMAWVFTLPFSAAMSYVFYYLIRMIG